MSLGLWVWLDPRAETVPVMKTILANKEAGCDAKQGTAGYALYVNEWETSNGQLVLEYGTSRSGCSKLSSGATKASALLRLRLRLDLRLRDHNISLAFTAPMPF